MGIGGVTSYHRRFGAAAALAMAFFVTFALGANIDVFRSGGAVRGQAPVSAAAESGASPLTEPPVLSQDERKRRELANWQRPEGPLKVALQAGHWKSDDVPEELENLKFNGGVAAGKKEWEINLSIAKKAAKMLEEDGFVVEILPATVPPDYYADAFVAIHADVNPNKRLSGFKTSAPWRDFSGKSQALDDLLDEKYAEATKLPFNPDVSENMGAYYAFNWRQFEYALHPMTPAAIIETGYMTNASDRKVLFNDQQKAAAGIAEAVKAFLRSPASMD